MAVWRWITKRVKKNAYLFGRFLNGKERVMPHGIYVHDTWNQRETIHGGKVCRLRLVEETEYLGAKVVRYSNDAAFGVTPGGGCSDFGFSLLFPLDKELSEPPDEDISPELIVY